LGADFTGGGRTFSRHDVDLGDPLFARGTIAVEKPLLHAFDGRQKYGREMNFRTLAHSIK